jgi:hypothetical protein
MLQLITQQLITQAAPIAANSSRWIRTERIDLRITLPPSSFLARLRPETMNRLADRAPGPPQQIATSSTRATAMRSQLQSTPKSASLAATMRTLASFVRLFVR